MRCHMIKTLITFALKKLGMEFVVQLGMYDFGRSLSNIICFTWVSIRRTEEGHSYKPLSTLWREIKKDG